MIGFKEAAMKRALDFLQKRGNSVEFIVVTDIIEAKDGSGFVCYYQDQRAIGGNDSYGLLGNVPIYINNRDECRYLTKSDHQIA